MCLNLTDIQFILNTHDFNQDISNWDVGNVN